MSSSILRVYLNDHLAGATAGAELARRMVQEHGDSAFGGELRDLAAQIARDRQDMVRLMARLGVRPRRYKVYGAWLGEKLGRVKPNGRLLRSSPLSVLVELEALRLGVTGRALLWRALLRGAPRDPDPGPPGLEELLQRAERQLRTLDSLHARAASERLSPAGPRPARAR
ncbi:hypothetical protein [Streptomyces sediminimaris]|uniref:hypothetical protein n=1 Tax=Streptomyces sediminimaris TaxID=3383721 RepID=UPI003999BD9A